MDTERNTETAMPSMSTDNTAQSGMSSTTGQGSMLAQVRDGMTVVDANGDEIGTVEFVRMGEPGAATISDETADDRGLIGAVLTDDDALPDVDEPLRSRLMRVGFVKIDGKGLLGTDRYVMANRVAGVSGDTVRLSVSNDQLSEEM